MPVSNRSQVIEQLARRVRAIECGVGREALTSRVCQASRTDEVSSQSDNPAEEDPTEEPGQSGERGRTGATDDGGLPTGIGPLDDRLPEGGLPPGSLVEWLGPVEGGGAGTLLFLVAGSRLQSGGVGIVIDRDHRFYPPATGFSDEMLARTIVLRAGNESDTLWALEQSLRCPGVAFVVCRLDRVQPNAYRRLKLAAETGGGLGLFPREERCRSQSSWADLRLLVEPVSKVGWAVPTKRTLQKHRGGHSPPYELRRLRLHILHHRGRAAGDVIELEIDYETGDVRTAPALAAATHPLRAAGA